VIPETIALVFDNLIHVTCHRAVVARPHPLKCQRVGVHAIGGVKIQLQAHELEQ